MGFADVGFMKYSLVADHYQYLALIAVMAAAAAGWSLCLNHMRASQLGSMVVGGLALAIVAAFVATTRGECELYRDAAKLYETTLEKNPSSALLYNNLGYLLFQRDELSLQSTGKAAFDDTIEQFQNAIQAKPDYAEAHNSLANAYNVTGRLKDAVTEYKAALEINPGYASAHANLGFALAKLERWQEAIDQYRQALAIRPSFPNASFNLANALRQTGQLPEAVDAYQNAIQFNPDFIGAYTYLAGTYADLKRNDDAIHTFEQAAKLAAAQHQIDLAQRIEQEISTLRGTKRDR